MFDSSLNLTSPYRRGIGKGALFSAVTHAAVIAAVVFAAKHAPAPKIDAPEVVFRMAVAAPAPPPPPPLGGAAEAHIEPKKKPVRVTPDTYVPVATVTLPSAPEPAPEVPEAAGEPGGEIGGVPGGVIGGTKGGLIGGTIGGTGTAITTAAPAPPLPPSNQVLPFGEGMTRPTLVGGPEPVFPMQAQKAGVNGTLLAKCVITTAGTLTGCRIIKSLAFMDEPVLAALAQRRYTPVSFQGRKIAVEYVISFKFVLR